MKFKTVTFTKEDFVEAWMRSAYVARIPASFSAAQLKKFEKLLNVSFHDEVNSFCNRLSEADLDLGMGEVDGN